MKPRALIISSLEQTLLEPLTKLGFTFSKSTLSFKRKAGDFVQAIGFQLNRYNEENICAEFWSSYTISSKEYSHWYKTVFGTAPYNDHLSTEMEWNIKNMVFPVIDQKQELHYQIIQEAEREKVLNILKDNILNIGIPYLDQRSDWERLAYDLIAKDSAHERACDFFLISGNKEQALLALEQGLEYWKKNPKASFPESKEELLKRQAKYFSSQGFS